MATAKTTAKEAPVQEETKATPLGKLKAQAEIMGIEFRDDITEKALRQKLLTALEDAQEGNTVLDNKELNALNRESHKLVRCIITPMASHMKDHQGQIFSVGNSVLGYISKYVLFNTEYHVPKIIVDHIKNVETQFFVKRKVNGEQITESKMGRAFSVDILPNLTEEELADLAKNQLARSAID